MNLTNITDKSSIENTKKLVREERELLTSLLHFLREINRRRLYSFYGYKSLFEFTVKYVGYPQEQAYRRIAAMKLLREIPEIESKISKGEISLTHISLAQTHFRQEKKVLNRNLSPEQKLSVLQQIANKPVLEAERITLSLSSASQAAKPDRVTLLTESLIEMKFTASNTVHDKVERLRGLLAHSSPRISLGELFEKLCYLGIREWDSGKFAAPRNRRVINPDAKNSKSNEIANHTAQNAINDKLLCAAKQTSKAQIRRDVFAKAKNQCENCGSTYALEVDHIVPQALGGFLN